MSTRAPRLRPFSSLIPRSHLSWFTDALLIFAVLTLIGIVYGFWQISQPSPTLEPSEVPASEQAP